MFKSAGLLYAAAFAALTLLSGCNDKSKTESKPETAAVPAAPEAPAAPAAVEAVTATAPAASAAPAAVPAATASPEVIVSGTEARAGDVSVKLPD